MKCNMACMHWSAATPYYVNVSDLTLIYPHYHKNVTNCQQNNLSWKLTFIFKQMMPRSLSPLASWLLSLCTHLTTLSTSFIFPGQVAPRQREAVQPPEMRITDRTIMLIKLEIIWFWMLLYFVDDGLNQLPMVQGQSADRPTAHDSPPAAQPTRPPGLPAWKNRKKSINTPSAHAYNTLYTTCAKHMRSWEEMGRILHYIMYYVCMLYVYYIRKGIFLFSSSS